MFAQTALNFLNTSSHRQWTTKSNSLCFVSDFAGAICFACFDLGNRNKKNILVMGERFLQRVSFQKAVGWGYQTYRKKAIRMNIVHMILYKSIYHYKYICIILFYVGLQWQTDLQISRLLNGIDINIKTVLKKNLSNGLSR